MCKFPAMYFAIVFVLVTLLSANARGQHRIRLSEKHNAKIEKTTLAKKKLKLYEKFYRKDSVRWVRSWNKKLKRQSDSLYDAGQKMLQSRQQNLNDIKNNKLDKLNELDNSLHQKADSILLKNKGQKLKGGLRENVSDLGIAEETKNLRDRLGFEDNPRIPNGLAKIEEHTSEIDRLEKTQLQDLTQNNVLNEANESFTKVQSINQEVLNYQKELGNLKDVDTNKLDEATSVVEQRIMDRPEFEEFQQQQALAEEIQQIPANYQKEIEQMADQQNLKEEARRKAKEKAIALFSENSGALKEAQKKLAKLKKKYASVQNSNDLSTAIKKSSLKGKPLKERLFIGGNFQVINLDPFSLDFSPSLGYMFNKKFIMGIGGTYRYTFGKYEANQNTIPENQYAANAFIQHDLIKGFFAFASYEQSNRELPNLNSDESGSTWIPGFMAGAGKTINVHPKINTSVMLLYNFLHEPGDSPYRSPWMFKTGFQLKKI